MPARPSSSSASTALFADPRHPYTAALLEALPERSVGKRRLATIPGVVPGLDDRPAGCLFQPRCRFATEHCVAVQPAFLPAPPALARCHYPLVNGVPTDILRASGCGHEHCRAAGAGSQGADTALPDRPWLVSQPAVLTAVAGVSFTACPGARSPWWASPGCGKSTLARLVTMIEPPSSGHPDDRRHRCRRSHRRQHRALRPASADGLPEPLWLTQSAEEIGTILEEPLAINTHLERRAARSGGRAMMAKVGLRPEQYGRYPHMFSGGQRQRIAIARP